MHSVYILYSQKADRFYIGQSSNPERRLLYHRRRTQRFTRRADDWVMVFRMDLQSQQLARKIESQIKGSKSRRSILRWIRSSANQIPASVWRSFAW